MSARRSRVARSYKAAPLHPLPGHKLHAFAKASQRYRPSALGIEARVFEAKLVAKFGSFNIDCSFPRGFVRACREFEIERFFGHAIYRTDRPVAKSVQSRAQW